MRDIANIYTVTKEVALTAAKREAELKDIAEEEQSRRDPSKPLTEQQKIDRICENRRRKWDCFHITTAQKLGCDTLYSTDGGMQKRKKTDEPERPRCYRTTGGSKNRKWTTFNRSAR